MKITTGKLKNTGNALLVALVLCGILCVSVAGYLSVAEQQYYLSMRSQAWNMAITVVEAGLEEGIEHCQMNAYTGNYTADGWQPDGIWYTHTTTLPNGDSYTVSATFTNIFTPTIIARANMKAPTLFSKGYSPIMFATGGLNGSTNSTFVTRAVQVHTVRSALLIKAMVAKHTIDMNGNGVSTDSYDSSNPFLSYYGQYDPNHVGDKGDVASNDTIINAVSGGNANIYGHLQTGPGGTASIGNNGGVGTHAYQAGNPGTFQSGYYSHDSNFTFPETPLPYNSGLPLGAGTNVVTVTYNISSNYVGSSGTYPNPPPWSGVSTNITGWITVSSVPSPVPSGLLTNTANTNSTSYPAGGTVFGSVSTNYNISTNTSYYPAAGTFGGVVSTNTANATSPSYPSAGSYVGSVSTNYTSVSQRNVATQPAPGTYVPGSLVHRPNGNWDYQQITSTTYAFQVVTGYSYNMFSGYSYSLITGYRYPTYTYNYANYGTNSVYQTNYYDHVISSGDYYSSSDLTGNTIVVGTARLVLPNGLNMGGHDSITIANGGSLVAYVGGTTLSLSGNSSGNISDGGVINMGGYPQNFAVYATSTVKTVSFSGNGEFSGVLVAPDADATMNGGGKYDNDFMGALVVNSVKMNGHFMFHYDEALSKAPILGRLLITSWDEIAPH